MEDQIRVEKDTSDCISKDTGSVYVRIGPLYSRCFYPYKKCRDQPGRQLNAVMLFDDEIKDMVEAAFKLGQKTVRDGIKKQLDL